MRIARPLCSSLAMANPHDDLTDVELDRIEQQKQIVDFDEQTIRTDHARLQVVRFTVRAPQIAIEQIRASLSERIYVDDSDPPPVGVTLPQPG